MPTLRDDCNHAQMPKDIYRKVKIVAAYRGQKIPVYLAAILRPVVDRDMAEVAAAEQPKAKE